MYYYLKSFVLVSYQVLEEIGVWQNITRFAGASAGAIVAMWAVLGYDSYEIEKLLSIDQARMGYGKSSFTARNFDLE